MRVKFDAMTLGGDEDQDRQELQQAEYDASLAELRYAACDHDNRLIAAQLEKAWELALQRVEACRQQLDGMREQERRVADNA